jgi:hypothetical protein
VDNNYLDLGMNKSGFVHTLPSGRLTSSRPQGESDAREESRHGMMMCAVGATHEGCRPKHSFLT